MRSEGALLELRTDLKTFKREEAALARDIGEQQSTLATCLRGSKRKSVSWNG
ncbi:hypothetical protein HMPREF9080_00974 [Cardiobacterium valvarum F0432]|uniref:Uncharacterized protein n=1 Tax=Cardiobacterium valvarum F0432 TaxID=797473 RepID=G9ZDY9_9GAMM|nr:hypothetical protein HMPREF9080_00974 [Cardiobacterium valvarum F0432]